ncbi:MAG: efflux RND transporter permease subunit, partial [Acidobacteriota bacterium]
MAEPADGRSRRVVARAVLGLALLVLGAVAAGRLPLSYLPSWSFPELTVDLQLPRVESIDLVTRLYVEPIEDAIRSLGGTRDMLGDIGGRGGRFRVRFDPGVDVETKAARLDSELEALRRRLPDRSRVDVEPATGSGGDFSNLVWLDGEAGARLIDDLRALPQIRRLDVAGQGTTELRLRARDPRHGVDALTAAARASAGRLVQLGQRSLLEAPPRG